MNLTEKALHTRGESAWPHTGELEAVGGHSGVRLDPHREMPTMQCLFGCALPFLLPLLSVYIRQ